MKKALEILCVVFFVLALIFMSMMDSVSILPIIFTLTAIAGLTISNILLNRKERRDEHLQ